MRAGGAALPPAEEGGAPFAIARQAARRRARACCARRASSSSDDHGGLLILADDAPIGTDIRAHLKLDDTLFHAQAHAQPAHCLSAHGIAREVSALTGAPLKTPAIAAVKPAHDATLKVRVEASDLCGRFSGRIVRGVNTQAKTPAWMVDRPARCGQRSVTALVDISNYVMFEYGRPSHIFDLDKIHGGLTVRWGRAGEQLELLNGNTIEVDGRVGVIADDKQVESLAGIMGGEPPRCPTTRATSMSRPRSGGAEAVAAARAASTSPPTQGTASSAVSTGADRRAHRAHHATDPRHLRRRAGAHGRPVLNLPKAEPVRLRVARAAKVIGMPVTQAQCEGVMQRLGLQFTSEPGLITVTPPPVALRSRDRRGPDREVARIVGYRRCPTRRRSRP